MFPFASHDKYGYDLSFAAAELKEAGDLAKKYGHRLTMHPGQVSGDDRGVNLYLIIPPVHPTWVAETRGDQGLGPRARLSM